MTSTLLLTLSSKDIPRLVQMFEKPTSKILTLKVTETGFGRAHALVQIPHRNNPAYGFYRTLNVIQTTYSEFMHAHGGERVVIDVERSPVNPKKVSTSPGLRALVFAAAGDIEVVGLKDALDEQKRLNEEYRMAKDLMEAEMERHLSEAHELRRAMEAVEVFRSDFFRMERENEMLRAQLQTLKK